MASLDDRSSDLLLQMDIEGAEYRVLAGASPQLMSRFRIIVLEFHYLANLFSEFGFMTMAPVLRKLLNTHAVVHIHPNNVYEPVLSSGGIDLPSMMEFTFYRRDRIPAGLGFADVFPHALDRPNIAGRPILRCQHPGILDHPTSLTTRGSGCAASALNCDEA